MQQPQGLVSMGNSPHCRKRWDREHSLLGLFKLDHLQPFEPFLFWQFSICFIFILGGQFLLPRRTNCEKGGHFPFSEMGETRHFQCLGHSNWTICSPWSPFCSGNFQFVSSLYWEANSYYPRGLIVRMGTFSNSKTEWDRGISVLGAFKLDHYHPFKPILF